MPSRGGGAGGGGGSVPMTGAEIRAALNSLPPGQQLTTDDLDQGGTNKFVTQVEKNRIADSQTSDNKVSFDFNSVPELDIVDLVVGEILREITVKIIEVFDGTIGFTVGYDSDPDAIIVAADLPPGQVGEYKFFPYKTITSIDTLKIFFTGTATQGQGEIFLEK